MKEVLELLKDAHHTLDIALGDSDIENFEGDDEEREYAPMQYAARKIAEAQQLLEGGADRLLFDRSVIEKAIASPDQIERAKRDGVPFRLDQPGGPSVSGYYLNGVNYVTEIV